MKYVMTPNALSIIDKKVRTIDKTDPRWDLFVSAVREKDDERMRSLFGDFSFSSELGEVTYDEDSDIGEYFFQSEYFSIPQPLVKAFKTLSMRGWKRSAFVKICHDFRHSPLGSIRNGMDFMIQYNVTFGEDGKMRFVKEFGNEVQGVELGKSFALKYKPSGQSLYEVVSFDATALRRSEDGTSWEVFGYTVIEDFDPLLRIDHPINIVGEKFGQTGIINQDYGSLLQDHLSHKFFEDGFSISDFITSLI